MEENKKRLIQTAETLRKNIWELAWEIGNEPEEGYKEYKAAKLLTTFLEERGFKIECPLVGMETAFRASFGGSNPGPRIVFLAEYDSLPDIGHGCGHNLIGAASVGAAAALASMPDLPGEVMVVGSPAEETSGAKVALTQAGIFQGTDAAMMFHPGSCNVPEISSLALDALEISYFGRATHMAVTGGNGVNALDALLNLFQLVKKLRKKLSKDERIDGIIVDGGKTPNIVPDKAVGRFYLRAGKREKLDTVRERFLDYAQKSAEKVGAKMQWRNYEYSYREMKVNSPLAHCFRNNLLLLGIKNIEASRTMSGSVDMGNVSHVVPAIHSYLQLGRGLEVPHTIEFAKAALSKEGEEVLFLGVRALALTGWDVLTDQRLQEKMQQEFYS